MTIEEGRAVIERAFEGAYESDRVNFVALNVFGFDLYDAEMDGLFVKWALDVCEAITERTTFEFIKDPEQYKWFLVMCNMPWFVNRIDWGGSIRGAWWRWDKQEVDICGGEKMTVAGDDWVSFVRALVAFGRDAMREGGQ